MDRATYPEVVAVLKFQIQGFKVPAPASGEQPCLTPPYLVLHREEFAWPRVSPCAPVRSYIKPLRAAPFHPSPTAESEISNLKFQNQASPAGLFSVALVVILAISNRTISDQDLKSADSGFARTPRR
jgi:hypothetical protein